MFGVQLLVIPRRGSLGWVESFYSALFVCFPLAALAGGGNLESCLKVGLHVQRAAGSLFVKNKMEFAWQHCRKDWAESCRLFRLMGAQSQGASFHHLPLQSRCGLGSSPLFHWPPPLFPDSSCKGCQGTCSASLGNVPTEMGSPRFGPSVVLAP